MLKYFGTKLNAYLAVCNYNIKSNNKRIELEKMLYEKAREEHMARHLFEHLVNIDNTDFDFVQRPTAKQVPILVVILSQWHGTLMAISS